MAQEISGLTNFVGNGGKVAILCREVGVRKSIAGIVNELGLTPCSFVASEDFREAKARKGFFDALAGVSELLVIVDFTSENSAVYFGLIDELFSLFREKLRVVAIVDKAYQGLVSMLFARGARTVLVKPFIPNDLKSRVAAIFSEQSMLEKVVAYGRSAMAAGKFLKALEICEKIIDVFEQTHHSLLYCGDVYLALHEYRKAGRYYMLGFKDEQLSFEAYARLAKLCNTKENVRGELFWLKKFAQISNLDYNNLVRIGELCLKLGRVEDAREYFVKASQAARKILSEEHVSNVLFDIANICVDNKCADIAREYVAMILRNGNISRSLLSDVAYFRMNKMNDPDGASSIYSLLAVREERRNEKMDLNFWSTALYNAAICHHMSHGQEKIPKMKNSPKRACDYVYDILSKIPDFGKNDPKVSANILAIASNPLQQNSALNLLLAKQGRA